MIKKFLWVLPALALTLSVISCNKEDDIPKSKEDIHHFAYASHVDNGFFITTFEGFVKGTKTSFSESITVPSGHLFMEKYGKYVYIQSGSLFGQGGEQTLYKYSIDDKGRISSVPVASLSFPGSPNVVELIFASETKAYAVTCASRGQLIVINPSTMKIIREIDLSPYAEEDNDPDAGNGIVRDGKLFLPLNQTKAMKELVRTSAQIAVIDIASDKVEKVIKDKRATGLGMIGHTCPILDNNGNLYFYTGPAAAIMCLMMPNMGYNDGLLRIKKGETDFDKDFYMSLQKTDGAEVGSYGMYMIYGGNDKIYLFLHKPSLVSDPQNPASVENKCFVPYEIDIKNKTGKILPMPASSSWAANAIIKVGKNIYFGEHTKNGIGFYKYDTMTGRGHEVPSIETPAGPYKIISLD